MDGPSPRQAFDIVVPPYMSMARVLERLEGVRVGLVQGQSIGFEGVDRLLPPGLPFANAASVHETSTAELALGLTIAAQRHIDRFAVDTANGVWAPAFTQSLADRRVLLLGYGGVGKAVAARLAPFEVTVTAVASRAREEDGMPVHGVDELPGAAAPRRDRHPDPSRWRRDAAHRGRRVPRRTPRRGPRGERRPRPAHRHRRPRRPRAPRPHPGRAGCHRPGAAPRRAPAVGSSGGAHRASRRAARPARCARGSRGSCAPRSSGCGPENPRSTW